MHAFIEPVNMLNCAGATAHDSITKAQTAIAGESELAINGGKGFIAALVSGARP